MDEEAQHRTILDYDIQRSTGLDDATKDAMRQRLRAAGDAAFAAVGVPAEAVAKLDRGDGMILLVRGDVPKQRLIDGWISEFHSRLERDYRRSPVRIQVRLAVHAGEIRRSAEGYLSSDIDFASRLVDAPEAKRILAATPAAPLAVVVSEAFYRQVVRPSATVLKPDAYLRIRVQVKETDETCWLALPGWARVPAAAAAATTASQGIDASSTPSATEPPSADEAAAATAAAAAQQGNVFHGPVGVVGHASGNEFKFGGDAR